MLIDESMPKEETSLPDYEPPVTETAPWRFRLALIQRQIELFSRYLKFHWRVTGPAPVAPQGFKFYGNRHVIKGVFEPEETKIFQHLLPHVDGMVNVGANVGYYCCLALQAGRPVIAFEPVDLNVRHLLANVWVNGWADRFEVLPVCLGNRTGVIPLYGGGTGASLLRGWANSPDSHANLAPIHTADVLLKDRLSGTRQLFMVDIEGAEAFFLEGAQALLDAQPQHLWILEISIDQHRAGGINPELKNIFNQFWSRGYQAWALDASLQAIEPARIDTIMTTQVNDLQVCNFLFLPDSESTPMIEALRSLL